MIGFMGGDFAWQMTEAGTDAAVDFVLGEVEAMVGSKARERFVKGTLTQWGNDPLTLGAYSALRPGAFGARAELARPLDDRLFFAGEAAGRSLLRHLRRRLAQRRTGRPRRHSHLGRVIHLFVGR